MTNCGKLNSLLLIGFLVIYGVPINAEESTEATFKTSPALNQGKKWRIAYYEGGPYIEYRKVFTEFVHGLMKLGWLESKPLPEQTGESTQPLWHWLATQAQSDYLVLARKLDKVLKNNTLLDFSGMKILPISDFKGRNDPKGRLSIKLAEIFISKI